MRGFPTQEQVKRIREKYPVGTRIELDGMENERDMPPGLKGTVMYVDDAGQLGMSWDNGRSLSLIPGEDSFHILPPLEQGTAKTVPDSKVDRFVGYINANVLPKINYEQLQASYTTEEKAYAKSVLNALHQGAITAYGTDYFDDMTVEDGFVLLPGVVQSKATGNLCIALLELDLTSSGEHWGTDFLIRYGCINQSDEEMPEKVRRFLRENYGGYDYCYTVTLENDIHVSKARLPEKMRDVLEHFKAYEFVPCDPRHVIGNVNDRPDFSQDEDMER